MARFWITIWLWCATSAATAQEAFWVQIEAQPTLEEGEAAASDYAEEFGAAAGFRLGTGWYAIALGPFDRQTAEAELARLRRSGLIPADSYLTRRSDYGARFYPGDATNADAAPAIETRQAEATAAEARRAERQLTRTERELVQTALKDAGFYGGRIDAAFGPGTRNAMAEWQSANGFSPTGILTESQRGELLAAYRAVLDDLGVEIVADEAAGVEVAMPTANVDFVGYAPPFADYAATDGSRAGVLLISQPGDRETLGGLYQILQTLPLVPPDGPRERRARSFTIEGRNDEIVSTTFAELSRGAIKGVTLVWPAGDERRRARLWDEMRQSFRRLDGVLPASAGDGEEPVPDLLSGLELEQPDRRRTGFFVDGNGAVLTTTEAIASCRRLTLNDVFEADVAARDEQLGLALLRPQQPLSPESYARFRSAAPGRSEIAVAGYPFGGLLSAPALTFGRFVDEAEETPRRLTFATRPGKAGGPVLDAGGAVLGLLLPRADGGADGSPGDGVSLAAPAGRIASFLESAGVSPETSGSTRDLDPEQLSQLAADFTVSVACWN